jgi:hypothetical protein
LLRLRIVLLRLWRSHLLPLQNFYLADYVLTSLQLPTLPGTRTSDGRAGQKQFNAVMAGPAGGSIERDRRQTACDRYSSRSDARVSIHAARLSVRGFMSGLKKQIYGEYSVLGLVQWPLSGFGVCLLLFVAGGASLDLAHNREARDGRRLRGPRLISRRRFNWRMRGDGLRFRIDARRNLVEWLQGESAWR